MNGKTVLPLYDKLFVLAWKTLQNFAYGGQYENHNTLHPSFHIFFQVHFARCIM
jgi:hypothetical protein